MPFAGLDDVVDEIVEHGIAFVNATPGVGKTRLLGEIVLRKDECNDRQVVRLSET